MRPTLPLEGSKVSTSVWAVWSQAAFSVRRSGPSCLFLAVGMALGGILSFNASAQTTFNGIEVVASPDPSTGVSPGWWRWETTTGDWSFIPNQGSSGGAPAEGPGDAEACAAAEAVWTQNQCNTHWRPSSPNGCGSGWFTQAAVPDSFEFVSFHGACNAHDTCYMTLGADKLQCDQQIGTDILAACNAALPQWGSWCRAERTWQPLSECRVEMDQSCQGTALIYQGAVMRFGGEAYQEGQNAARCVAPADVRNRHSCSF